MKIGVSLQIDVEKIDKERLFKGQKGTYLNLTTFIDLDNADQYGNNGFITQSLTKEERESGVKLQILGNNKVIFSDKDQSMPAPAKQEEPAFDDDIPF